MGGAGLRKGVRRAEVEGKGDGGGGWRLMEKGVRLRIRGPWEQAGNLMKPDVKE